MVHSQSGFVESIGASLQSGLVCFRVLVIKELDAWAFRECPLQTLTFLGTTPPKKTGAPVVEYGDDYICLVRVPKGSKDAYEKIFPDFDFDIEEYEQRMELLRWKLQGVNSENRNCERKLDI